jgi:hypothetical protein
MARADPARAGLTIRCAIYTRKSSDEGLEQEFNSLDAQREACEAYIVSQRHAGWVMLSDMYDDGGLSGGTMERPALKRLLEDIQASKVQIVVVYKVDRLTRSLSDFAKKARRPDRASRGPLAIALDEAECGAVCTGAVCTEKSAVPASPCVRIRSTACSALPSLLSSSAVPR